MRNHISTREKKCDIFIGIDGKQFSQFVDAWAKRYTLISKLEALSMSQPTNQEESLGSVGKKNAEEK